MEARELVAQALKLKPEERIVLVESIIASIQKPDPKIDEIWAEEAEKRLEAYRNGRLQGIPMEEIF
ncbi:MAG: addiction module protein [Spirochaetia bacterium]|nr:addiction module protein [Spirochaetia bacterium]